MWNEEDEEYLCRILDNAGVQHTRWEVRRSAAEWRRQHPWRSRWHRARDIARSAIWKLTRIDIG